MNKLLFRSRCLFLMIALISILCVVFYQKFLNSRSELTRGRIMVKRRFIRRNASCILPRLDPFHKLAMQEMEDLDPLDCGKKNLASVVDGHLLIDEKTISYVHMQYVQRPEGDDFNVQYSKPLLLTQFEEKPVLTGNFGCLVAGNGNILQFDEDLHVISTDWCVPEGFLEIMPDGRIRNLKKSCLTINEDCTERCSLVMTYECSEENSQFEFEANGVIRHSKTGACVEMTSDSFGDYTELILSRDCGRKSSRWRMHNFPEKNININVPISEDFIRLVFIKDRQLYLEYHASVVPKKEKFTKFNTKKEHHYDIVVMMLESQSASNVVRKMPQTFKYLNNERNTFLFHGHTIVGDGTTAQLCAILVGQLEEDLPETRRNIRNSGFLDDWPLIFNNFSKDGFATLFSEDSYDFASFNYRLNGFERPPTDHYSRIFWHASKQANDDWRCVGDRPHHRINLDYTLSFFNGYKNKPKLSLTLLSAISHNNFNNIQHVDDDLVAFIKGMKEKGHLENTFMFIVGDHGLRTSSFRASMEGSLEEKLPFFALSIPERFLEQYPHFGEIIKENTQTLTSHFDIHATLVHLLNFPHEKRVKTGQSLLSLIDPEKRTCESAGVQYHWCPCMMETQEPTQNDVIIKMADRVVNYINRVKNTTHEGRSQCANLELKSIVYATKHIQTMNQTNDLEESDSFISISDSTAVPNKLSAIYQIVFTVNPSGGTYEVSVYKNMQNKIHVDPNISRLDLYGDQPKCIMDKYPHLRKFCFCKE